MAGRKAVVFFYSTTCAANKKASATAEAFVVTKL
jgi:hypothetical protein